MSGPPPVCSTLSSMIGNTPMFEFQKLAAVEGCKARLFGKMESANPCGSVKDRIACRMIEDAESNGKITPEKSILIEPTSGNTGIALAFAAAAKGYKLIIIMPETMSIERRILVRAFGAEVRVTPGRLGMMGAVRLAEHLVTTIPNAYMLQQFTNPANVAAHYETTAPEIVQQMDGKIDMFICGVGTGGTLTGVAQYLKEHVSDCKVVAVEPAESAVLSGTVPGPHKIQGIGAGFMPAILDRDLIDEIFAVPSDTAIDMAAKIPVVEGILVGISAGSVMHAGIEIGKRPAMAGKNVVIIIPDFGERYLSTPLFKSIRNECANMKPEWPEEEV